MVVDGVFKYLNEGQIAISRQIVVEFDLLDAAGCAYVARNARRRLVALECNVEGNECRYLASDCDSPDSELKLLKLFHAGHDGRETINIH